MVNNLFSFNVENYMIKIKTKLKESDSINKSKNEENNNEDNFDKKTIDISKKSQKASWIKSKTFQQAKI